ncbi:MFS general substrate transporter [Glarea lozoyensis ATCC 20868]|uniref:MFS general substrate transporter n=1 Tax=Glarea lozoyensis (strain ATCC 20868 / MF5171) TaxID=1116229 RepID=S3DK57_GLAL2|nr:MFS general substrate transporter [Glarea lozoyensis ATCC 20868]EPE26923.1 MFS general substrate transporter [Glarea lozoyensis ATCC 20868]
MNQDGSYLAEDSCFIKYHSQDAGVINKNEDPDVEKGGVKKVESPGIQPVNSQPNPIPNEKGILYANQTPESDNSTVNGEDDKDDFPEGGLKGWSVVLGSFCGSFSVFGIINSTAILLDYLQQNQLKEYSPSALGWIFGTALFLTFFCGAPIGPIFDAYGPRALIFAGSILLLVSIFLLGLCSQYWHFFIVYSLLNGIGGCLINTPCIASIGHYFLVKRGNATGIAMTSGSIGGIIFPLMLQKLFPTVGFAWATRILGFILLFLLAMTNLLVRSRLPRKPLVSMKKVAPDFTTFKDLPFTFVTIGIFLMEWGIFVPLTYITSYTTMHGHSAEFGFQILAIMNGGSFFGRLLAGIVADMIGRVNTLIISIAFCIVTCFGLWLPAGDSTPMIVVFAVIFGFVSGSNLSLSPVCVGQMCKTENYGRYFATCWMVVAFGTLTGLPIAGQILTVSGGKYEGVIIFAGMSYVAALACLIAARVLRVGWKISVVY